MTEAILGAIYRADADSITGWCWCAARRQTQCDVEILIDGAVWRQLKADRRVEGVRLNGPPHDHFGFLVALPPRHGQSWHRIEAREVRTGRVFGRLVESGADPDEEALDRRIADMRGKAEACGAAIVSLPRPPAVSDLLGAIGRGLRGTPLRPISLPFVSAPRVTLAVTGCGSLEQAYAAVETLAPTAAALCAEILLCGLADRLAPLLPAVRNLRLTDAADGLEGIMASATGTFVLILDGPALRAGADLAPWLEPGLAIGPRAVRAAAWLRTPLPAPSEPEESLILAIERALWPTLASPEGETREEQILDLAMQARLLDLPLRTAGPPGDALPIHPC